MTKIRKNWIVSVKIHSGCHVNKKAFEIMLVHISNNYLGSTVHSSLANALEKEGVKSQFVYCPLQRKFEVNSSIVSHDSVRVVSPRIFNQVIRYFPIFKILYSFLFFLIVIRKHHVRPSFVLAHNFWSDGMIAYLYHCLWGTPYLVAVRSTDVNVFVPKLWYYRWIMRRVSASAVAVVSLSPTLEKKFVELLFSSKKPQGNFRIIPNGLDDFWYSNKYGASAVRRESVVYVGSTLRRKNVEGLYDALLELKVRRPALEFIIVGWSKHEVVRRITKGPVPEWVKVVPRTSDKMVIAEALRSSRVFATISWGETFGLVYLEALSQGCSVVFAKGEGVDELFDEPFLRAVPVDSIVDAADEIDMLMDSYPAGIQCGEIQRVLSPFSWRKVARQFICLFNL